MKDVISQCPIEEAMVLLSGRWPTLLLYYLKDGTKRFSDLGRDNPMISHRILAHELRKLEARRGGEAHGARGLSAARGLRPDAGRAGSLSR